MCVRTFKDQGVTAILTLLVSVTFGVVTSTVPVAASAGTIERMSDAETVDVATGP